MPPEDLEKISRWLFWNLDRSIEKIYQFLDNINKIHPTIKWIKFTLEHSSPFYCGLKDEHDCWCHRTRSIPFLDTKLYIKDGKITTDLYRKPTNRCIYLLPPSCHPAHISNTYLIHLHTETYEFAANQNLNVLLLPAVSFIWIFVKVLIKFMSGFILAVFWV